MLRKITILLLLALVASFGRAVEEPDRQAFERSLSDVLAGVGERFGVKVYCKRIDPDTVQVPWASFRMRPYSLDETLDNITHPLGLVWTRNERLIVIQPYEYYRRTPADGAKLLAWLTELTPDRAAWEARRERIVTEVRRTLALEPFLQAMPATPVQRVGKVRKHDGYRTQNFALETLPGLYVCGTLYLPESKSARGAKLPLVVAPSGHWEGGRYRPDHQYLMATLARMGAVAVDMDIVGWGESEEQIGTEAHTRPYAMQLQLLWSKVVMDWVLREHPEIDTARMAATGGSGGATHALLLAVTDGRLAALAPVAHLVSHFDGGCACESALPVTLAADGSCMPEILAAAMAPRPVLTVSDGGDWTASYPTLEYPFLQRIWGLYDAADRVRNVHLAAEKHDFGPNKRRAVYEFFAETLGLDLGRADESAVGLLPAGDLQIFGGQWPAGAIRSRAELERIIENLK